MKGASARGGERSPVWPSKKVSARTKGGFRPIMLGVNAAKDAIRRWLHVDRAGPGYMHFPADRDLGYFAQLTAERSVLKTGGGQRWRVWELPSGRANEALDCRVYAYAALCGLVYQGLKLNRRADEVGAAITPWLRVAAETPDPEPPPSPAPTAALPGASARPSGPRVTVEKKPGPRRRLA